MLLRLLKRRWNVKESDLQQQIIGYLSAMSRKYNFIFFAPCNEGFMMIMKRFKVPEKIQYAIMAWLSKMGFTPGVSDIIIGHNGKMYCPELKTKTGVQSKNQKIFQANAERTNIDYVLIRSLKQLQDKMYEWGIIC